MAHDLPPHSFIPFDAEHLEGYPELATRLGYMFDTPPRSQFQTYGPLAAWLGIRFNARRYLVKPQKLLRQMLTEAEETTDHNISTVEEMRQLNQADGIFDAEMDQIDPDISINSIDSTGAPVTNKTVLYPDFSVERFWGADRDEDPADQVAVVMEVASVLRVLSSKGSKGSQKYSYPETLHTNKARQFKLLIRDQLVNYLGESVYRSGGKKVLGVLLLGSEVLIGWGQRPAQGAKLEVQFSFEVDPRAIGGWIRTTDLRFMEAIDRILQTHN